MNQLSKKNRLKTALAMEILSNWDAVVVFCYHPRLASTNNEAVSPLAMR